MNSSATAWLVEEGEEWELRNDDDGFTYKILKRQRLGDHDLPQPAPLDHEAEERRRRERKRNTLLKLKSEYQKEIERWELLSNTLRAMEERTNQQQLELRKREGEAEETASLWESSVVEVERAEDACESVVNDLLWKVEAQEAIIRDVSNLCDVAEAMCNAREEQLAQSFIDLPIWSSPRALMASLCDDGRRKILEKLILLDEKG